MMRLLRAVLAYLRNPGQRPSRAEREPRLNWKGTPVVQGCQASPAGSQYEKN
jgi:hypothetical protein